MQNFTKTNVLRLVWMLLCFMLTSFYVSAQKKVTLHNAEVIPMTFHGELPALRDFKPGPQGPRTRPEKLGYVPKGDWPLHDKVNPNALPKGMDPAWQNKYPPMNVQRAAIQNFDGNGYSFVNPADPITDVGPNHVIQMTNQTSGSTLQIWDKSGNSLVGPLEFDQWVGFPNIGLGDPIVCYDALADRWLLSEFTNSGNQMTVAVSTTADPTSTYYLYTFTTPNFPDYPKYGVWTDAYYITTNESGPSPVYALDRAKMLVGAPATMQRFTIPDYPTIGFQATTPVTHDTGTPPPPGAPGMVMRMADDAWSASIANDRLEMWDVNVDFTVPANSNLTGPTYLATAPFDTELCGYISFSCFGQPDGGPGLDPLREVLMNRIQYRNFGTHEALVCNHVTDVTGNNDGGVRWYELRRNGGIANPWSIYQQGTYAPDNVSRWMAAISINESGDIGLLYNVVDNTDVHPGLRYTGRCATDPLGTMTYPETVIVAGSSDNGSNRFGDYNSLDTDPANGSTFWGTGMYNPATQWSTRIAEFNIDNCQDCALDISCAAITDVTVPCDEDVPTADTDLVIILEACGEPTVSSVDVTAGGNGCPLGTPNGTGANVVTRTYTATDEDGTELTCEQTITIRSDNGPTITCPATKIETCIEDFDAAANLAMVSASAECGDASIIIFSGPTLDAAPNEPNNCNGATYTVTYQAEDDCGRTIQCTQQVAIANDPPTIDCDPDETVECVEDINPTNADVTVVTSCDVSSDIAITGPVMFGQDGCDGTVYQYTYTVTDACGREASCTRSYTLENDGPTIDAPANMIVDCFSSISVNANDATVEYACMLGGTVEVSDPVQVGDDDCPGTTYTYTYTVTDECGRSASDEQVFTIQNAGPTIASPADQIVECASDIATDVNAAVVTTSCTLGSEVTLSGPVQAGPTNCPGTTYTYTYTVTDDCGRVASDDQVFTIGENDPPTIAVVPNITVDCFESINPDPAFADVTTACGNGVDYEVTVTDPVLGFGLNCPGETYSVVYTITDACGRTASATQTFIIDNDGPTMECPDNCEVLTCYDGDYNAIIEAWINTVEATSSCSAELTVFNTYNGVNGICVYNGFTPVTFSATDACGRTVSCESGIFITDTDAPDIYETPEDLLVPCTANTEQIFSDWLADYGGAEAVDACGGAVTWSADTDVSALNCANGPQAIVVTFTATDGCGNSASVVGTFNTKLLPNAVNVAGLIQTEATEAVSSVEVSAYQSSGMAAMDLSDDNGDYNFEELPYEEDTEIVPSRDGDYLNGVSTFDLILLQQHILGIQTLNSPYKRIAADANRSGTISTLDLVLLRRLILHIDEELADNTSWRFVDADFVFPNPANPFETDFPEAYNLSGEEEELKDFVAVKIGDLNLDAWTNSFTDEVDDRSGLEELIFEIKDQKLKAGETYQIDVTAQNFAAIRGFQMTLDYDDSQISVLDIEQGALPDFSEANYNLAFAKVGQLPLSWNDQVARDLNFGDVAFRIIIKPNADIQLSEVLSIGSSLTKAEAYNSTELMNVSLNFSNNGTSVLADKFELFQNTPNPFKASTMIGFQLPEAGEVILEIYDIAGKLIYVQRGDYPEGYSQIDLDRADLQAGILYYQVSTATDSESKKMIVLD